MVLLVGAGCNGSPSNALDAQAADAGRVDAGAPDSGDTVLDSGAADAGNLDSGMPDVGARDTGPADAGPAPGCVRSLCMAGAFTRSDGANPDFRVLCERLPGLILDGAESLFAFRGTDAALEALIQALDSNQDGQVDGQDEDCDLVLGGYSWGGVNITNLAQNFVEDGRVHSARAHVETMFVIDPYAPTAGRTIEVPAEVQQFWEYRHSISPSSDCSGGAPLGPYEGLPPLCAASSACQDYDYSLAPGQSFTGLTATRTGMQAGHCTVVDMASPAVLHNVMTGQAFGDAPPAVPVGMR